jgi:hypothetical protein
MQTSAGKPSALVKPTLDTRYRVDYSWWDRTGEDLRVYLLSHLLPEQRERLSQTTENRVVDFIDPETGEVTQLDELGLAIQLAAKDPNFINPHTSLVDSIFRVFLANGNEPLSPRELEERTGRSASTILKTLSGGRIYKGIRPVQS